MKKRIFLKIFISTLIILLFSSLLFLTSCGGGQNSSFITQTAIYRGKELYLKVKVYKYNINPEASSKLFFSKATFANMEKAILKKYPDAEISEENHRLFIKLPYENSFQKAYFMIQKASDPVDSGKFPFASTNMEGSIMKDGLGYFDILMPLYMFPYNGNRDELQALSSRVDKDQEYEISNLYDLEDIYHFYQESGYFQIKITDNSIILEKLIWDEDTPIPDYCVIPSPITISFRVENNKHFIAYSMEKNKDE